MRKENVYTERINSQDIFHPDHPITGLLNSITETEKRIRREKSRTEQLIRQLRRKMKDSDQFQLCNKTESLKRRMEESF